MKKAYGNLFTVITFMNVLLESLFSPKLNFKNENATTSKEMYTFFTDQKQKAQYIE